MNEDLNSSGELLEEKYDSADEDGLEPEAPPERDEEELLGYWGEWKEKCAIDRCSEEALRYLGNFGYYRYRALAKYVSVPRKGRDQVVIDIPTNYLRIGGEDKFRPRCWHLLESYVWQKGTIDAKPVKDWLFDRVLNMTKGTPLGVIEAGATDLMKEVVRRDARFSGPIPSDPSLSMEVIDGAGKPITLEDILPPGIDPERWGHIQAEFELASIGKRFADEKFADMDDISRVALLANALRISLDDPDVRRLAGRQKAALYEILKKLEDGLRKKIDDEYSDESEDSRNKIFGAAMFSLKGAIIEYAKPEKMFVPLFRKDKERQDNSTQFDQEEDM